MMQEPRAPHRPRLRQHSQAAAACLLAAGCVLSPRSSTAVSTVTLSVSNAAGEGWSARDIAIELELPAKGVPVARMKIARVVSMPEVGEFNNLLVTCQDPVVNPPQFVCRGGTVTGQFGRLGRQRFLADVAYDSLYESLSLQLRGMKLAGGVLNMDARLLTEGWRIKVSSEGVDLNAAAALAKPWFALPEGFAVAGRIGLAMEARGRTAPEQVQTKISVRELTANNAEGTLATDKLDFDVEASLKAHGKDWDIATTLRSASGQAYADPIFVDFKQNALEARMAGRWLTAQKFLQLALAQVTQTGVAVAQATGELDFSGTALVKALDVNLKELQFPGSYAVLMQPFLLSTEFKDLATSGHVHGMAQVRNNLPQNLRLTLENVTADDKEGKLGITRLNGNVVWANDGGINQPSHLEWTGAKAYGLTGGSARVDFITRGTDFKVLQQTLIPVLDGGLFIRRLEVTNMGKPDLSLQFDAEIKPISMPLLCRAFDWPEFSGVLAGSIPGLSYDGKQLTVDGVLTAQAFGGNFTVTGLRLRDPLSDFPRLNAELTMRGLDLQAVTGTFSFGSITGRLDGEVRDLELFNWSPVRMDLKLYTPPDDKSRRLISQRAVQDLSSIGGGGGAAAALSSGFLKFFENFRYQKLGISCRLEKETCHMNGVENARGDAYYIVKGSGLPRIDVIGNARRVNWEQLLNQIKTAQASGGPTVGSSPPAQ